MSEVVDNSRERLTGRIRPRSGPRPVSTSVVRWWRPSSETRPNKKCFPFHMVWKKDNSKTKTQWADMLLVFIITCMICSIPCRRSAHSRLYRTRGRTHGQSHVNDAGDHWDLPHCRRHLLLRRHRHLRRHHHLLHLHRYTGGGEYWVILLILLLQILLLLSNHRRPRYSTCSPLFSHYVINTG